MNKKLYLFFNKYSFPLYVIILFALYLLVAMLLLKNLYNAEYYQSKLHSTLSEESIQSLIKSKESNIILPLVLIFACLLLKIIYTAICLTTGGLLIKVRFNFSYVFKLACYCEFIFLAHTYIDYFWLLSKKNIYTNQEIQNFTSLSLMNFMDIQKIQRVFIYPLETINLFEFFYVFLLAWGLKRYFKNKYSKSLPFTGITYGIGILLWLVFYVFINI